MILIFVLLNIHLQNWINKCYTYLPLSDKNCQYWMEPEK